MRRVQGFILESQAGRPASKRGRHGGCFQPPYRKHRTQPAAPPQRGPSTPATTKSAGPGPRRLQEARTPRRPHPVSPVARARCPDFTPRCCAGHASVPASTHLMFGCFQFERVTPQLPWPCLWVGV